MPEIRTFSRELGGKTLTVETGRVANLANGSLTVR
jgi:polyribonucleotide nucleotidyltransferase